MRLDAINADGYDGWRPNSYFENMLRIKQDAPKTFAILSPSEKIALEVYLEQKTAATTTAQTETLTKAQ